MRLWLDSTLKARRLPMPWPNANANQRAPILSTNATWSMSPTRMGRNPTSRISPSTATFRTHLVAPRRSALRAILEDARTRSELRPDADIALAVNMLVGAYYAQYLADTPFADEWSAALVDAVLAGVLYKHDP